MFRRAEVRKLAERYLKLFGLNHWRMTRLYIGIPRHIKRELAAHYPDADNGFYACVYPTSRSTFVMAISARVPHKDLENVVAHEISHILLWNLWDATTKGRKSDAKNQLEVVCDRIARALTKSKCA